MQEQPTKNRADAKSKNAVLALNLARSGYKVFPCNPSTKAPMPGLKWRDKATDDLDRIKAWWRKWPDAMPGLPTGKVNGVSVVDLDVDPARGKDGIAAYRDIGLDPDAADLVVRTAGGGLHLYFEHQAGVTNSTSKAGIDVRGDGGYVIAPGAHAERGRYKVQRGDLTICKLLGFGAFPATLERAEQDSATDQFEPSEHDLATIKDALHHIPNDGSYDDWNECLMAVHHATGGSRDGLALALGWSAGYPGFSMKEVQAKWRSYGKHKGSPITVDTLFMKARQNGWQAINAEDWDDDGQETDEAVLDTEALALLGELPTPEFDYDGLTFTTPSECANSNPRPYVIKGLLAERDVACIVGAPGVGKSLLAPRLAYAVAQGERVFDRRVKQGGVFYVAAEDEHGMRGRLTALRKDLGDAPDLHLVGGISDLLTTEAVQVKGKTRQRNKQADTLVKAVRDHKPGLVVIDTLAMAFPGLEENSAEGMGRVVALARRLTKWGAAVIIVHHDTKDGQQGLPRGHSLLNGALDVSIHLRAGNNGVVKGKLTKNRNGSCDVDLAFRIHAEDIGIDADGDPITAAVCEPCGAVPDDDKPKLNSRQVAAFDALIQAGDGDWVQRAEWRERIAEQPVFLAIESSENRRKAVQRAVETLVSRGLVEAEKRDNGVFRPFVEEGGGWDDL